MSHEKDVIIALDFPRKKEVFTFLDRFPDSERPFVKIGMELFYAEGADIVRLLKDRGYKIFLDLKLHDIPNTVKQTIKVLASLQVDMINLHAAGGSEMMQAAQKELSSIQHAPLLIAVTQLTSTNEETLKNELLIPFSMEKTVLSYAQTALRAGLDGVVCSPWEAKIIKEHCGKNFITVTPGIRFADDQTNDQKRIMTPEQAGKSDCDFIVVGRPITQAENPVTAYRRCKEEFFGI